MRFQHAPYVASYVAAFVFAPLAPALVFGALGQSLQLTSLAFYISLGHAVVLGLPLFLLFHSHRWINAFSCLAGGFVVGIFPIGFFTWPFRPGSGSSTSINGVPTIVDGIPTIAGWISYAETLISFGSFGVLAGFVFWLVLKLSGGLTTSLVDHGSGQKVRRGFAFGFAATAILLAFTAMALPIITRDRTCHNMSRDGGGTFSVKARIHLPLDNDDWPRLRKVLEDFSMKRELSLKDFNQARPDLALFLDVGLCDDRGTNIFVNERQWSFRAVALPPSRGVGIFVYEVRPNSGWQRLVRDLVSDLEAAWPEKVRLAP